jgi:hypothetical protein
MHKKRAMLRVHDLPCSEGGLLTSHISRCRCLAAVLLTQTISVKLQNPSDREVARRGSVAFRLLGLRIRIPPGAWMSVSCECCVLSGRGLCVGLITLPEESYRMWCVSDCDREAWIMRRPWPTGAVAPWEKKSFNLYKYINTSVISWKWLKWFIFFILLFHKSIS